MKKTKYSEQNIKILKGVQAIRKLPSMYIGSVGVEGKLHILKEIIDNSIDEHMSGFCDQITLKYYPSEEKFCIQDNGRGLPHGTNIKDSPSMFEKISTTIHAGRKFEQDGAYTYSGGKHGVGMSATNSLSIFFEITTFDNEWIYHQQFSKGLATNKLTKKNNNTHFKIGTKIVFIPDPEIFIDAKTISVELLINYLREKQYINPKLKIKFYLDDKIIKLIKDEQTGLNAFFDEFLTYKKLNIVDQNYYFSSSITVQNMKYSLIFGYVKGYNDFIFKSFVNNIETYLGGTHINVFLKTLTSFLEADLDKTINSKVVSTNLVLIFNCMISKPDFANQTKTKLNNKDIKNDLKNDILKLLTLKITDKKPLLDQIKRNLLSKKRAEELKVLSIENNKKIFMSGQLKDCLSKNFEERELFIVEGRSAGGTAVNSRNKMTQAVLTLRGKLLNTLRASRIQLLKNQEVKMIMSSIGIIYDIQNNNFICEKPKYNKIIIAADADPDGKHIQLLFLTMIFTLCPSLINNGFIYIANTPLFRVSKKNNFWFFFSKQELLNFLKEQKQKFIISRFKGLGEMDNKHLRQSTFDPKTRFLTKIVVNNIDKHSETLDKFMGKDSKFRKTIVAKLFETE